MIFEGSNQSLQFCRKERRKASEGLGSSLGIKDKYEIGQEAGFLNQKIVRIMEHHDKKWSWEGQMFRKKKGHYGHTITG